MRHWNYCTTVARIPLANASTSRSTRHRIPALKTPSSQGTIPFAELDERRRSAVFLTSNRVSLSGSESHVVRRVFKLKWAATMKAEPSSGGRPVTDYEGMAKRAEQGRKPTAPCRRPVGGMRAGTRATGKAYRSEFSGGGDHRIDRDTTRGCCAMSRSCGTCGFMRQMERQLSSTEHAAEQLWSA